MPQYALRTFSFPVNNRCHNFPLRTPPQLAASFIFSRNRNARDHAGGISFRFMGSSAVSIARLAAITAASLRSALPDFVPVSVSTDHFQSPGLMPWMIRYSTPRCSMLMHRAKEER